MKRMLMLGAMIAATAAFAAPETAQAEHCYSGYGGARYGSGYSYAPRSYSYGYSSPRHYRSRSYGGSHYGHGRSYGRGYSNYGGRGYSRGYGGFGIGVRTRGFSFSYRR